MTYDEFYDRASAEQKRRLGKTLENQANKYGFKKAALRGLLTKVIARGENYGKTMAYFRKLVAQCDAQCIRPGDVDYV